MLPLVAERITRQDRLGMRALRDRIEGLFPDLAEVVENAPCGNAAAEVNLERLRLAHRCANSALFSEAAGEIEAAKGEAKAATSATAPRTPRSPRRLPRPPRPGTPSPRQGGRIAVAKLWSSRLAPRSGQAQEQSRPLPHLR